MQPANFVGEDKTMSSDNDARVFPFPAAGGTVPREVGDSVNPLFLPFECAEGGVITPERLELHARAIARMTRDTLTYLDAVALETHFPDPTLASHGYYAIARGNPVKMVKAGD